ncbi:MAG: TonB-dependent receptor [Litorimonas sp.]
MTKDLTNLKWLASTLVLGALTCAIPAYGQDAQDNGGDVPQAPSDNDKGPANSVASTIIDDEVISTGIRNSVATQRAAKRNGENISDGIYAEDIGKLPDENIAEAMSRITGIGIDREDGEGSSITIRGVEASLNNVTLNGIFVPNGGDDNAVDFQAFSADMLKSIEVIKSPSADQDEGSLGASVRLKTFRPLEIKEPRRTVSAQLKQNDLADKTDLAVKLSASDKFFGDNLGVVASLYYDEQTSRVDGFQAFNWRSFGGNARTNSPRTDYLTGADLGDGAVYIPVGYQPNVKLDERTRYGGTVTFQVAPDDVSSLTLDLSYSYLEKDFLQHNSRITGARGPGTSNAIDVETGSTVVYDGDNAAGTNLSRHQITETKTYLTGLTYERSIGQWDLEATAAYSIAEQTFPLNRRVNFRAPAEQLNINWLDDNGGFRIAPILTWDNAFGSSFDPNLNQLIQIFEDTRFSQDENIALNFDVERQLNFGPISSIEIGAKYTDRTKTSNSTTGNSASFTDADGNVIPGPVLSDPLISSPFPFDDFLDRVAPGTIGGWQVPNFDYVFDTYLPDDLTQAGNAINDNIITTETLAGYAKANIDTFNGRLKGDVGVRVVETKSGSIGSELYRFPGAGNNFEIPGEFNVEYTNVLPSGNLRYALSDEALLRVSAAKVMSRPPQSQLRPGSTFIFTNNANLRANGANPFLEPTEAWQYDASFEWYFGKTGLFSAAAFYKDIKSFNYDEVTNFTVVCPDGLDPVLCATVEGQEIPFTRVINGEGGHVKGLEFAFQQDFTFLPGPLKDFGTVLNYTYSVGEATVLDPDDANFDFFVGLPFRATSKDTLNATVYWEKNGHSLRLAYNYRTPNLRTIINREASIWQDTSERLDLSAVVNVNKRINLTLAVTNLTDESDRRFISRTLPANGITAPEDGNILENDRPTWRTENLSHAGRNIRLGVTAKF